MSADHAGSDLSRSARRELSAARLTWGIVSGLCTGLFVAMAVVGAAQRALIAEEDAGFGVFLWNRHWFWRAGASVAATAAAAFVATCAARCRGEIVSAIVAIPTALAWGIAGYLCFTEHDESPAWQSMLIEGSYGTASELLGNRLLCVALALGTVPLAYSFGVAVQGLESRIASMFDNDRWSIFGVRWYHWTWLTPIGYLTVVEAAWGVIRMIEVQRRMSDHWDSVAGIGTSIISFGYFGGTYVAWSWLRSGYESAAGLDNYECVRRPLRAFGYVIAGLMASLLIHFTVGFLGKWIADLFS